MVMQSMLCGDLHLPTGEAECQQKPFFQHDLHVLNDRSGTRLDVYTGAMSHIDLRLCTTNLAHQLAWRVQM